MKVLPYCTWYMQFSVSSRNPIGSLFTTIYSTVNNVLSIESLRLYVNNRIMYQSSENFETHWQINLQTMVNIGYWILFAGGHQFLSWDTRIKVAVGAARGLSFLHDTENQVIHRDFHSAHILLDEVVLWNLVALSYWIDLHDKVFVFVCILKLIALLHYGGSYSEMQEFNAKLSGINLAKDRQTGDMTHMSTRVMGTNGYAAPEYIATGSTNWVLLFH